MKTFISLIIIFIILLFNTSGCKKADTLKTNSDTTIVNNPKLLSKFIFLNTTNTKPPFDTSFIAYYKYDNNKRLIQASVIYYNYQTQPDTTAFSAIIRDESYLYYKSNADTLPFKIINSFVGSNGGFFQTNLDTIYRFYNTAAVIIKDSNRISTNLGNFYGGLKVYNNEYGYDNGSVFMKTYELPGFVVTNMDTIVTTKSNGNTIYQQSHGVDSKSHTFTFDTHPNPLFKNGLGFFPIISHDFNGINEGEIGIKLDVQKNNYLTASQTYFNWPGNNGTSYKNVSSEYTYGSDGYPLKVLKTVVIGSEYGNGPNNSPTAYYTGIYIYN